MKAFWDSKIQVFDGKWNIDENTFVLVRREEVVFFILELLFHFLVFSSTNLEVQVNLALTTVRLFLIREIADADKDFTIPTSLKNKNIF